MVLLYQPVRVHLQILFSRFKTLFWLCLVYKLHMKEEGRCLIIRRGNHRIDTCLFFTLVVFGYCFESIEISQIYFMFITFQSYMFLSFLYLSLTKHNRSYMFLQDVPVEQVNNYIETPSLLSHSKWLIMCSCLVKLLSVTIFLSQKFCYSDFNYNP